jgi:deoxyadenosine/deoxycytidine kinase
MLIILEGPDGVGKTTLANALLANHTEEEMLIRHCGPLRRDPIDEYLHDLDWYSPGVTASCVYDRHYIGELIYGPLYRGGSRVGEREIGLIERKLNEVGAMIVFLYNNVDTLRERNRAKGEDFLQDKDLESVVSSYENVYDACHIIYKMRCMNPTEATVTYILKVAKDAEERANDRN